MKWSCIHSGKDQDSMEKDLKLHLLYHVTGITGRIKYEDRTNSGGEDRKTTEATEISVEEEKL